MKKFIIQISIFISIFIIIVLFSAKKMSIIVKNREFKNYETESNLLIFKENKKYDFMFMGISHARNFSRHKNHLKIEKILNKNGINIAQGGGTCGVAEQLFYLKYFYKKNNTVNTIIYVLTPPMLFSETLPIASNTFNYETLELDFFLNYLFFKTENKSERLINYVQFKLNKDWITYLPKSLDTKNDSLILIDTAIINKGFDVAYSKELNMNTFNKSCKIIENTIKLSKKNNSDIILIIPPAVFGKWTGHDNVIEFAISMTKKYNIKYYDYSETILEPNYYYDHHHLNTKGVIYFTEKYLTQIM